MIMEKEKKIPRTITVKFDPNIIADTNDSLGKLISLFASFKNIYSVSRYIDSTEQTSVDNYWIGKYTSSLFKILDWVDESKLKETIRIYDFINHINNDKNLSSEVDKKEIGLTLQLEIKDTNKLNQIFELEKLFKFINGVTEVEFFYVTEEQDKYKRQIISKLIEESNTFDIPFTL